MIGGVVGGLTLGGVFYHFMHRDGAPNSTLSEVAGGLVGAAMGAAGGALLGGFVGSLVPKHTGSEQPASP